MDIIIIITHGQHSSGASIPAPFGGDYLSHASTLVRLSCEPPTLMQTDVIAVMSNPALLSTSFLLGLLADYLVLAA